MRFLKATRAELEAALAADIRAALEEGSVLWLLPGGSNVASVVAVMELLADNKNNDLTLLLGDERFGPIDHADSNYYQLRQAGLNLHGATFVQTLSGSSLEDTIQYYAQTAEKLMTEAKTVIGFFGMGADGHIAGILPRSPAIEALNQWAVGYQATDFTRLTLTPFALSHVDVAYLGAFGSEKGAILHSLAEETVSSTDQPAQILKHLPRVEIYNDQLNVTV